MSLSWTLWEFAVCAPHFFPCPISCQPKRAEETTGTHHRIVSLGSYNTDWCFSWNLTVWRQEAPDVLNNKMPQADNERQLWKRQGQSLDVATTVLQAETGNYQCTCVKHFCYLLCGNASFQSHTWDINWKMARTTLNLETPQHASGLAYLFHPIRSDIFLYDHWLQIHHCIVMKRKFCQSERAICHY